MLLPNQVVSFSTLKNMGYSKKEIEKMRISFVLFPTPFKGIYYVPFDDERKSKTIHEPLKVLTMSILVYLDDEFYYSCRTAEEWHGINWHPSGIVHIVNPLLSKKIDLEKRTRIKEKKKTYYSKNTAAILSQYGKQIIFHRSKDFPSAKFIRTPAGRFATKRQIKKDKKRFNC